VWGTCTGQVLPTTEICNGADDNCDGQWDEGNTCLFGPNGVRILSPDAGSLYTHLQSTVDVHFTGEVNDTNGCCDVKWEFGDGSSIVQPGVCDLKNLTAMHPYSGLGYYTITLSVNTSTCTAHAMEVFGGVKVAGEPVEVLSDATDIFIQKEPYHPPETTLPTTTTQPPTTTTQPTTPTTQPPAPTTTQPAVTTTIVAPTSTTLVEEEIKTVPEATLPPEEPQIIGYASAPIDWEASLRSSGLRNLIILLILIAGYAVWARDTQLMKRADEGRKKPKK